ncbi:bi-domain-containing oxidoreductase [Larkinella soli]|uniref:bi-domain-containing oxidoreductase n=1 Tax=Larkinella soli TaxID=1770527 RepID=UPI000FFC3228|nr:bi-domain-containing oxidoreductase [Larkinella soli]
MKQLIQNLRTGETLLEEVPAPQVSRGQVLIRTRRSLVSPGTERMLVEFGRAGLIAKARQQPEKVRQVLDKIRSDGLIPTLEAVFHKLDQPLPLGYCNAGEVLAVGEGVSDLTVGDRVASNGPHAEVVCVPRHLVARIPDEVSDEQAAFTVIGAVGLQGLRLLNPTLGETVVVMGLGLIGLLTAQLLQLNGCRVIGLDPEEKKLEIARQKGIYTINPTAGDPVGAVLGHTGGVGADGVIVTASAQGDELISQAARMSRKRGRIVLVGVVGLNLNRTEFYEKELTFQVSCSYGPGRYDETYERLGQDYPLPYVRWTENRNFETVLGLLASGRLEVQPLISEVVPFEEYRTIYDRIGSSRSIASLLTYPEQPSLNPRIQLREIRYKGTAGVVGLIGAGNFTGAVILPALQGQARLKAIASAGGLNGTLLAKKHGFSVSTTDYREVLNDPEIDLVVITTRHHQHARMTVEALQAGKHVFVEKPLAIFEEELEQVIAAQQKTGKTVMVGFNRRFSPHSLKMKSLLGGPDSAGVPMHLVATMNAGFIPGNLWFHNRYLGGGRILGEACHFVDLLVYLTGSPVSAVCMTALGRQPKETTDSASLLLRFENGSTGVVNYFSNGHKAYSKERIEVFSQERTLILDNFRTLKGYGFKGFSSLRTRQDKGHRTQFQCLVDRIRSGGEPLIPFAELINTSRATLAALQSLRENRWVEVPVVVTEPVDPEPTA